MLAISEFVTVMINTIRLAKASLTGIEVKIGVLKFKDGPHLDDLCIREPDF